MKYTVTCPVDVTLRMIGGKYKSLILWYLLENEVMRYGELQKNVILATPKMLTQQLRELENDGLVHREVFPVVPPKVEYSLTAVGKSLKPILTAMYQWGEEFMIQNDLDVHCEMHQLD